LKGISFNKDELTSLPSLSSLVNVHGNEYQDQDQETFNATFLKGGALLRFRHSSIFYTS